MTDFIGEESIGRVQHDQFDSHFGTMPASRVSVSTLVGQDVSGTLEEVLRAAWERISSFESGYHRKSHITADATVFGTTTASITTDAVALRVQAGSIAADATVFGTATASIAADAVIG